MAHERKDSFNAKSTLEVDGKSYDYFSIDKAKAAGLGSDVDRLPFSLKVLLENLLRNEDGVAVSKPDVEAVVAWAQKGQIQHEVNYYPSRVLLQDFTGVPAVVDLAAMREATTKLGGDAQKINPLAPADLVIDHSVMVDHFGTDQAFEKNVNLEFDRNQERYQLLKWAQTAFRNFRVVPPGTGICHQVNLEYLAEVVFKDRDSDLIYPDTVVGTDSHTTMINGIAVLGWGVGGIEAEAAMLRQPITMMIPDVVGFKIDGQLAEGVTATDLVLTVTQMLRAHGVVGKFVEFYGDGLEQLSLADRATIANMAPEYGATCGFFPIDDETINYMRNTGRDEHQCKLVEAYAKAQGMWRIKAHEPVFTSSLSLNVSEVRPSISGPKRPQDKILLADAKAKFHSLMASEYKVPEDKYGQTAAVEGKDYSITHGDIMIAAITSCTNTSNPSVMLAAGIVAKKAFEHGLKVKPHVKTSLAPGSQVVTDYLEAADLQRYFDQMGYNLVGYGCTTCIGNSGPLAPELAKAIHDNNLVSCSVLSGNRNFEGRIGPDIKANFLMSPPLVVAYSLVGSLKVDIATESLGKGKDGKDVYLKDIWPTNAEISAALASITPEMFKSRYGNVFEGPKAWQEVKAPTGFTYEWDSNSTYIQNPPFFDSLTLDNQPLKNVSGARALAVVGDNVTTDHISPAGAIKKDSPAGKYLTDRDVKVFNFNSFGSRRGNHEIMMRGTFANVRFKNEMVGGKEGGYARHMPDGEEMYLYDAAMKYQSEGTPLVVFGGKEYGMGSSRDWAAKGTMLLGVKCVVVESFERIHRSNLIGMGVLPLEFPAGTDRKSHNITGEETYDFAGIDTLTPRGTVQLTVNRPDGSSDVIELTCRVDTETELEYLRSGGILQYVIQNLVR